jgi:hypothetical protein
MTVLLLLFLVSLFLGAAAASLAVFHVGSATY